MRWQGFFGTIDVLLLTEPPVALRRINFRLLHQVNKYVECLKVRVSVQQLFWGCFSVSNGFAVVSGVLVHLKLRESRTLSGLGTEVLAALQEITSGRSRWSPRRIDELVGNLCMCERKLVLDRKMYKKDRTCPQYALTIPPVPHY